MGLYPFGAGKLFFKDGLTGLRVGVAAMHEVTINIDYDIKKLHGDQHFAVDIHQGLGDISGGAKFVDWRTDVLAAVLNETSETGQTKVAATVPASVPDDPGPYTVTPTVPESGTFNTNLQVLNAADGSAFVEVEGTPGTGEYTCVAGEYTFAAGDANVEILIAYTYDVSGGRQINWTNKDMCVRPVFSGIFANTCGTEQLYMRLANVVPHGFRSASKLDDFQEVDMPFAAFANPITGEIGQFGITAPT